MKMEENNNFFQKRQTAFWMNVGELLDGTFRKEQELSSYKTKEGIVVSRVNVYGIVLSKDSNNLFESIDIEDGTGKISVKSFDKKEIFDGIEVEDIVNVIGKIREYNGEPFISAEVAVKKDKASFDLRKKELPNVRKFYKKEESAIPEVEETVVESEGEKIMEILREMDDGNGVDTEALIQKSGIENAEKIINDLIHNGDVFEIRPGKIKVLE